MRLREHLINAARIHIPSSHDPDGERKTTLSLYQVKKNKCGEIRKTLKHNLQPHTNSQLHTLF